MEKIVCGNCGYFYQHYILTKKKFFKAYCGHCGRQRSRKRKPDQAVCESYVPALPDEDAFVNKEYLSKELLDYILRLELLPEMEEFDLIKESFPSSRE